MIPRTVFFGIVDLAIQATIAWKTQRGSIWMLAEGATI